MERHDYHPYFNDEEVCSSEPQPGSIRCVDIVTDHSAVRLQQPQYRIQYGLLSVRLRISYVGVSP